METLAFHVPCSNSPKAVFGNFYFLFYFLQTLSFAIIFGSTRGAVIASLLSQLYL